MKHYAGIDVSLEDSSVCVMDAEGRIRRAGMRKAKVALARKLAVVLHRMLRDRTDFIPHMGAPMAA